MSENQPIPQQPEQGNYRLPDPTFPSMDMPQAPVTPDMKPEDGKYRPDCEGQIHQFPQAPNNEIAPPKDGRPRILIGIPLLAITYEFFESWMKFWTELNTTKDIGYEVGYHIAYRKPVHMAEEYLVEIARFNKCTHILLMDDDIYDITKADLDNLLAADKDCIGGVMYASKFPIRS